jgi:BirA family biotin operon repressor/biotin-[acetyl-CoA-carboxylase] ligase
MKILSIVNPFQAPVFHEETVSSTMDISRELAARGASHGTVILADVQTAGRGRTRERAWQSDTGNLYCTILLRYNGFADIPKAITLKTGLAAALAIEDFAAGLTRAVQPFVQVKWPNDIMLGSKKAAGIISEGDGKTVFTGIGVNVAQTQFPGHLLKKATSIALACGVSMEKEKEKKRFALLEKILFYLYRELRQTDDTWRERLSQRLYMKDKQVRFIAGGSDSPEVIEGVLRGINEDGELLILSRQNAAANMPDAFISGELDVYDGCSVQDK